jgi:CRP-like cAMP-binding protein
MKAKLKPIFDADAFLRSAGTGKTVTTYRAPDVIFSQGDTADSVLYIQTGAVKLAVLSSNGKEAVVGMLGPGDFFGEQALAGHPRRLTTAISVAATTALVIPKQRMIRLLHENHAFSDRFIAHMLARNIRIEEDLIDQNGLRLPQLTDNLVVVPVKVLAVVVLVFFSPPPSGPE